MTNLRKIGLTALAGTLATTAYAQAGELTVSGTARMEVQSNKVTTAAAVESESDSFLNNGTLTFSGSGELDNGFGVSYYQALADGSLTSSNVQLDMGDMGTLSMADHNVAGIGTVSDIVPNGGEQPWDDIGTHGGHEDGVASPHTGDRLGYTMDAGVATITAAVDLAGDGATTSAAISSTGLIDGLKVVAGTADVQSTATATADIVTYGATYTMGSISVGAQKTDVSEEGANDVERDAYGISMMINDNLSIGYGVSDVEYEDLSNDEESKEIGAVYTSGGMTIGLQNITKDNINGTAVDHEMTELQLTFAF